MTPSRSYAICRSAMLSIVTLSFTITALNIHFILVALTPDHFSARDIIQLRQDFLKEHGKANPTPTLVFSRAVAMKKLPEGFKIGDIRVNQNVATCISLPNGTSFPVAKDSFARLSVEQVIQLKQGTISGISTSRHHEVREALMAVVKTVESTVDGNVSLDESPRNKQDTFIHVVLSLDCQQREATLKFFTFGRLTESFVNTARISLDASIPEKYRSYAVEDRVMAHLYYDEIKELTPEAAGRYAWGLRVDKFRNARETGSVLGIPLPTATISGALLAGILLYLLAGMSALESTKVPHLRHEEWLALTDAPWVRTLARAMLILAPLFAVGTALVSDFVEIYLTWPGSYDGISEVGFFLESCVLTLWIPALISLSAILLGVVACRKLKEIQFSPIAHAGIGTTISAADLCSSDSCDASPISLRSEQNRPGNKRLHRLVIAVWLAYLVGNLENIYSHFDSLVRAAKGFAVLCVLVALVPVVRRRLEMRQAERTKNATEVIMQRLTATERATYGQLLVVVDNEETLDLALAELSRTRRVVQEDEFTWRLVCD